VAFQGLETLGVEPRPELLRQCPPIVGARDMSVTLALCAIHRKVRRWLAHHPVLSSSSVAAADSGPAGAGRACSQSHWVAALAVILGSRKGAVSYVDTATQADWARLRHRFLLAVSLVVTVPF